MNEENVPVVPEEVVPESAPEVSAGDSIPDAPAEVA